MIADWAWCASGWDWVVCCPFSAISRCCDAQTAVVLKVSSSAHGGCTPSRPIACSGLQFLRFNACPFEVGFKVILVSLFGAPRIVFSFSLLTVEKLARDSGLIHSDYMASPA